MQERTAFRLAMLANGYQPLLNNCKRPIEKGWPRKKIDEAEILSWDRSALASTGLRIDGDLAVIDADIADQDLIDALAEAFDAKFPEMFAHGLVRRTARGIKEAWIARVDRPFGRLASREWYRLSDPDTEHHVECYGSLGSRQFGVDGPHSRDGGVVTNTYAFDAGATPATVPRSSLPVLPKAVYAEACNLFDQIAADAGLTVIKAVESGGASTVYDLTNDMAFEDGSCSYALDELDDARIVARHEGHDLRVTSSFLGHGTNPRKCIVGWSHRNRCVCVHDFETGITHLPADQAPRGMTAEAFNFLEELRRAACPAGETCDYLEQLRHGRRAL